MLELHHDKHHAAYVKGLNTALDKLQAAHDSVDTSAIDGLAKTLAFNLSGHVLHTLLWQNLGPNAGGRPNGELAAALDENFGSFDKFQAQMNEAVTTVQDATMSSNASR